MTWSRILSSWLLAMPILVAGVGPAAADSDWTVFKARFVQADGRVVDTGKAGISHTEGQGVAMLLAVRYDDRDTFDAVWQWTRTHLQVREDKLLAWRWTSGEGVTDKNNATDGDLFVAWALLRAHRKWSKAADLVCAKEMLQSLRQHAMRATNRGTVLLPGVAGFDKPEGLMLNLSYWVFPAFPEFAQVDPAPQWDELRDSGLRLLGEGRFGRWGLPSDWMYLGERLTPAPDARFGYDAVRIPLYLLWAQLGGQTALEPFMAFWSYFKGAQFLPPWTSVLDNSIDSYNASAGIIAISQLVLAGDAVSSLHLPALDDRQDYYSAILLLLTKAAVSEIAR